MKLMCLSNVTRNVRSYVPSDDEKKVLDQETAIEIG